MSESDEGEGAFGALRSALHGEPGVEQLECILELCEGAGERAHREGWWAYVEGHLARHWPARARVVRDEDARALAGSAWTRSIRELRVEHSRLTRGGVRLLIESPHVHEDAKAELREQLGRGGAQQRTWRS